MGVWAEIGRCLPVRAQRLCCISASRCGRGEGGCGRRWLPARRLVPQGCSHFPAFLASDLGLTGSWLSKQNLCHGLRWLQAQAGRRHGVLFFLIWGLEFGARLPWGWGWPVGWSKVPKLPSCLPLLIAYRVRQVTQAPLGLGVL